ncbi:peptidoglycan D,D-transpeptidase FtsI family protein [Cohnella lupini]|uniref:Penicillin-binding protein 2 n=1 Tax=Cohnella lupini TaxID=1294267 RepID=A0A3D9IWX4_9BACL|nr:penicillin-binding transpeptidase domain-containing protein [Cohnella lupini]RED66330.1 penicillin-binding protein 2 [Cohnella lupini]
MSKIMTEKAQKSELSNRRHFSFRLNVFFFVTFSLFSLLIVRLAYLQFVEGETLRAKEHENGSKRIPIPPIRGNIYDSAGNAIAYSISTQSLYYTLDLKMKADEGMALAARIVDIFNKLGNKSKKPLTVLGVFEDMDLKGRVNSAFQPRRIKSGLTQEEIAYFSEHRDEFEGIEVVEESIRQYSNDKLAVQLVGYLKKLSGAVGNIDKYKGINNEEIDETLKYLTTEQVGADGLELMYQDELRGRNGFKEYPINKDSQIIGPMKLTKPIKGDNLYLTINNQVQLIAQQAITDQIREIRTAPNEFQKDSHPITGYAVAMEVKTGKVVAMASMPDYDPSLWQGGISEKDWESVQYFMSNGTIRDVQPPYADDKERSIHPSSFVNLGSTQKPLTVLVGLSEKLITPNSTFLDPGYFAFGSKGYETEVSNASRAMNGLLTPTMAIAKSSNAFMAKMIGNALYLRDGPKGVDIWDGYMKQFGLGVITGSGLPNESKGKTNYYEEIKSGSSQSALVYASFGQQAKYSTLQLAQYAATLASHGKRMKPQFVNEIKDTDGNLVQPYKSEVLNTIRFPDSYWKTIEDGMALVNVQGFDDFDYHFYRKTGTSQQDVGSRKKVENAVFIAYAPAEDPVLAVAVVVPDGGYGGYAAAPIARKIFDAYDSEIGLMGTPRK